MICTSTPMILLAPGITGSVPATSRALFLLLLSILADRCAAFARASSLSTRRRISSYVARIYVAFLPVSPLWLSSACLINSLAILNVRKQCTQTSWHVISMLDRLVAATLIAKGAGIHVVESAAEASAQSRTALFERSQERGRLLFVGRGRQNCRRLGLRDGRRHWPSSAFGTSRFALSGTIPLPGEGLVPC